ncbi:MAG: riboflavin synthase [bacterium]|nr:riboflavin synthase [bacterium]
MSLSSLSSIVFPWIERMFTGIIEEVGKIRRMLRLNQSLHIQIEAAKVLSGLKIGDSIAVNGVCLTVVTFTGSGFEADIIPETVQRTTFSHVKVGDPVNLERAMQMHDRFHGHFVQGHVDGVGKISRIIRQSDTFELQITVPSELVHYIVPKGSIAVDGVSLTVVDVTRDSFRVALIPFTREQTTLGNKTVGSFVNIETDILAKYIIKQITQIYR